MSASLSVEATTMPAPMRASDLTTMPVALSTTAGSGTQPPRRILCYGDSLTVGFHSRGASFEPYAQALVREFNIAGVSCEVSFCGHSGRTAKDMVEAADSSLRDVVGLRGKGLRRILQENGPFDLALIMAGTNDMGFGAQHEEILRHLRMLHEVCHERSVPTVALAPPPAPSAGAARELTRQRLVGLLQNMAQRSDRIVACVDPGDYLPSSGTRFWDPDGLHFSAAGSQQLGRCLATLAMERLFVERLFAEPAPTPRARPLTAALYTAAVGPAAPPRRPAVAVPEQSAALPAFCMCHLPVYVCA